MAKKRDEDYTAASVPTGTITQAWRITIPDSNFTGKMKYVEFFEGLGSLCGYGFAAQCPEYVVWEDPHFRQVRGTPIAEYARYFSDHGFRVEEITVEEGLALYHAIAKKARDYVPPATSPPKAAESGTPSPARPRKGASAKAEREVLPHEQVLARGAEDAD